MAEIVFIFNGIPTTIQCKKDEPMNAIIKRFYSKNMEIKINSVYFLNGGKKIDSKLTFNDLSNQEEKRKNKMNILVSSYENENNENNNFEISKDIICPKCGECCLIKIKDYKITLCECKNGHDLNDLSFENFEKSQQIDLQKIKCDNCDNNRSKVFQNSFYKCLSCKKNLCPLCKEIHNKEHDIIEYIKKYYICNIHNEIFVSYCNKCKDNLCMFCESDHKDKENLIYYRDILPNKNLIKNQINELRANINSFKEIIQEFINWLNKIIKDLEIYYNINNDIINNFEKKNRNFQLLKNINEIINNNKNILEDLKIIKNNNDKNDFFLILPISKY